MAPKPSMLTLDYPAILDLIKEHRAEGRTDSAAFLIWYLENYYRLDVTEAQDCICDTRGDKGVDGIFVNDNDRTITILQSRISQVKVLLPESAIKTFQATLAWFQTADTVQELISSAGEGEIAKLVKRLEILAKIDSYEVRGEMLSNIELDANSLSFLKTTSINFVGRKALEDTYISDAREIPPQQAITFDVIGLPFAQYTVDADTYAVIAPVKATELVKMSGIADQSLFAFNLRGPLGKTGVNKDIVASVKRQEYHKLFPLFHNGITVVTEELSSDENGITVEGYSVVNGCQSLTALFENSASLTGDLRIMTKFIKMPRSSTTAEIVTRFSNNQNGITARDFMANDAIQIRLQNEIRTRYKNEFEFEIKRGDPHKPGDVIPNEEAGLYLMAFDLKKPWATHRRYRVFQDEPAALFARPEVTADRVVLCHVIREAVDEAIKNVENERLKGYVLLRYMLIFAVREMFERDDLRGKVLTDPGYFVHKKEDRDCFRSCVLQFLGDAVTDLNMTVSEAG